MLSPRRSFSRLFIERAALNYPDAADVCARFPHAERVIIDRYHEIINRSHQNWRVQKRSQALVLAVRRDAFLYPMPTIVQSVGPTPAFYNTPLINCVYDCSYCYLQGMFASANAVMFVNSTDFFAAVRERLEALGAIYLSLSYDTDILGFEGIAPLTRRWIEFARTAPNLTLEIRTKSGRYKAIADIPPPPNVILAWTVSPEAVVERFERGTAGLTARLSNIAAAVADGWSVRLCFDPVLWSPTWRTDYATLIDTIAAGVPLERIKDATVGVFRMNQDFFKALRKTQPRAAFEYGPLTVDTTGVATYPAELEAELRTTLIDALRDKIALVHTA